LDDIFALVCYECDMQQQMMDVTVGKNYHHREKIAIDINEIPTPTAIYLSVYNEVILNRYAFTCLGMRENEIFDLKTWGKINPFLNDTIKKYHWDTVIDQKIHVILFNGKHEIMNYSLSHFSSPSLGKIIIIHFSKASEKYAVAALSSLYSIKDEIIKLRPYLNRTGQKMLQNLITKYFREENQQLTLNDLVYYEKELRLIQKAFPSLSFREVVLCSLLVHDMESQDIASITNRSLDAVFVTIHRINRKLAIVNKKRLVDTLKQVVTRGEQMNAVAL